MNKLELVLKKKWYDRTISEEKPIEYREIKPYWAKRFCKNYEKNVCDKKLFCPWCLAFKSKQFDFIRVRCGYSKTFKDFSPFCKNEKFEIKIGEIRFVDFERFKEDFEKDGFIKNRYYFKVPLI